MDEVIHPNIPPGFLASEQARRFIGVSDYCLRKWANAGKIPFTRVGSKGSHRRYDVQAYFRGIAAVSNEDNGCTFADSSGTTATDKDGKYVIYARVSSKSQETELGNQIDYLRAQYPTYELITDIGSGLNFKRRGFTTLLGYALSGTLRAVVVTYKDRLCRWGFELLQTVFERISQTKIVVLAKPETSPEQELCNDLISIVTVFTAKIHGRRRYRKQSSKRGETVSNKEVQDVTKYEIAGVLT